MSEKDSIESLVKKYNLKEKNIEELTILDFLLTCDQELDKDYRLKMFRELIKDKNKKQPIAVCSQIENIYKFNYLKNSET